MHLTPKAQVAKMAALHASAGSLESSPNLQTSPANDLLLRIWGKMPLGIFRADLLPEAPISSSLQQPQLSTDSSIDTSLTDALMFDQELQSAFVPLDYTLSYPALPNGIPIWGQLPWEPLPYYQAFEFFLSEGAIISTSPISEPQPQHSDLSHSGRDTSNDGSTGGTNLIAPLGRRAKIAIPKRRLDELLEAPQIKALGITHLWQLQEAFYVYFWGIRTQAYDVYMEVQLLKQRKAQAQAIDNQQLGISDKLLQKALNYIDTEEFDMLLTPKTALELLQFAMRSQRISVGLPGTAPSPNTISTLSGIEVEASADGLDTLDQYQVRPQPQDQNQNQNQNQNQSALGNQARSPGDLSNSTRIDPDSAIIDPSKPLQGQLLPRILQDEETALVAQELIMRVIAGKRPSKPEAGPAPDANAARIPTSVEFNPHEGFG